MAGFHERVERDRIVKTASEKSFGLTLAGCLFVWSVFPLLKSGQWRMEATAGSLALLAVSLTKPVVLAPLNRVWAKLGWVLERTVTPLIVGLIFLVVFVPFGAVLRALRVLKMRSALTAQDKDSCWVTRQSKVAGIEDFKRQF